MLRNDLIVASRALASPRLRDQSVAFRNQSAVRVWVERVERAWVDFEKQKPGCDDGVIAWVVRLASRKLLDAAEPEIGLSPKLIDALKDIFPSAAQLRDRIRKKFHAPIVASLQEEADANARSASRSRMLEERLKLDPDRYSSTVAVVDNKDFAHKLLNELFKKNSYKNLLNLSEYLIEEELDEAGKAELRDMRDALKAMQRIMSN
jgi:DNA primase